MERLPCGHKSFVDNEDVLMCVNGHVWFDSPHGLLESTNEWAQSYMLTGVWHQEAPKPLIPTPNLDTIISEEPGFELDWIKIASFGLLLTSLGFVFVKFL